MPDTTISPLARYLRERACWSHLDSTDRQYNLTLLQAHDKLSRILEHDPTNKKAADLRLVIEKLTEFLADHE